jgi:DNA-binding protein YbaB
MDNALVGTDSTGCIRLMMNEAGRITDVDISALWRTKLGPERFTAAVVEALGRTVAEFIAAAESVDTASTSHDAEPVADVRSASTFEHMAPGHSNVAMHRLADLMDKVLVEISQHLEQSRLASGRDYIGTDDRRHVKVTLLESGVICAVEIDERWLASASTERLTRALRDALQEGYERIDQANDLDMHMRPATEKLRTMKNDPEAFRHFLQREEP